MKVLLTGASSYVGARLYFDLRKSLNIKGTYFGTQLSTDFIKLDVTNKEDVEKLVGEYKPNIIVHAAANASASWCEQNPELATSLNQKSTESIVESANKIGAKIILLSSFIAKNPINVYGETKAASEQFVKNTKAGFIILRPSLIIGFSPNTVNDRPFNRILKNIDEKTEAIYDVSWKFQPTYIRQISEIIEALIKKDILNKTIPIAVKELKTRYDIANDILGAFDIKVTPIDKHDNETVIKEDLHELKELNLPEYSYAEVIKRCILEIKDRNLFKL